PAAGAKKKGKKLKNPTPVIFVHGGSGSGAQFESQQMRLTSNGFPQNRIFVIEYDTLTPIEGTIDDTHARLDALIERIKQRIGKPKVDVLGHSRGTTVMHEYLASPERAANVRRYVNIDGRTSDTPPGGVRTLAIWAEVRTLGPADGEERSIGGARNVTIPNQTHVQVATSRESFAEMFEFLIGKEPRTTKIKNGKKKVTVAGRAVIFPQNTGVPAGTELEVWKLNGASGERKGNRPVEEPDLSASGAWGPLKLKRGKRYEFALYRADGSVHHLYPEPFLRNDRLVRLLSSIPGEGIEALLTSSDQSTVMVIIRYKELWGDAGAQSDVLRVNGLNILTPATSPVSNTTNGVFVEDFNENGASDSAAPHPVLSALPFLTGVDVFIPAASPPNDTVEVSLVSRGKGRPRSLNVPNWTSSTDRVSVIFNDHEQRAKKKKKN
ncbi:MAG TPA: alpha/beta fold hydrolase, partial [Solirubrobacterales bacterium]|nr:alpha/beta fold hydrolase [Solirubrobacterales bacterium]